MTTPEPIKTTLASPPFPSTESFAEFLRSARIQQNKTMGQMARELGITVVYYSEVESGKKSAFPERKVNYALLSEVLGVSEAVLKNRARWDREQRSILKTFSCSPQCVPVAVSFGRRLTNNDLTEQQLRKIQKILNEVE